MFFVNLFRINSYVLTIIISMEEFVPDRAALIELANYRMPFGKYKGQLLVAIPEPYYVWYSQKGFPVGKLGNLMAQMNEIKINGLEKLIWPLVRK